MADLFNQVSYIAKRENGNNLQTIDDLFYICKNEIESGQKDKGLGYCKALKNLIDELLSNEKCLNKAKIYNKIFDILVLETPYSFDSYFQALEWDRPVEKQFYLPRRNIFLKHQIIQLLEDLLINDKIDEAFLSMPPRCGKTTLVLFVISWLIGINPQLANLYCSNSGVLAGAFYDGINTILTDEYTYCWHKIFPKVKFDKQSMCNAKETYLHI